LSSAHARHGVRALDAAADRRRRGHGPGIAPAERSRVVQRFYRGDYATGGGTGLGLAIANEIALAHQGAFSITDAPGGGARFEMRFPSA
jgi:signal transduction histidine kinase